MLTLPPSVRIWLATQSTDMRRSIDGLAALVRAAAVHDVYSGHLFVFFGRRADRIKVLFWDRGGFVVYYKRLERGRFRLPVSDPSAASVELEAAELSMLLDGLDARQVRRPARWVPPASGPARAAAGVSAPASAGGIDKPPAL